MDQLKIIYNLFTDLWMLFRKYGNQRLTNQQLGELAEDGMQLRKKYQEFGADVDILYRKIFMAIQEYYSAKK